MSSEALEVDGECSHCGKDLSQQEQVKIADEKVYCNKKCRKKINYGVTGEDGFTRISSREESLPRPETIGAKKIVEVNSCGD